jgi:hypothetical protein
MGVEVHLVVAAETLEASTWVTRIGYDERVVLGDALIGSCCSARRFLRDLGVARWTVVAASGAGSIHWRQERTDAAATFTACLIGRHSINGPTVKISMI